MGEAEKQKDIDIIDCIIIILALCIMAATQVYISVLLWAMIYWIQHAGRRTARWEAWVERISEPPVGNRIAPFLLPPVKEERQAIKAHDPYENMPFHKRISMPVAGYEQPDTVISNAVLDKYKKGIAQRQQVQLQHALRRLPRYFSYKELTGPPSRLCVPLGYEAENKEIIWVDFDKKVIHALVAGQTGSGKDALLRLWFSILTAYNTPQQIQFIVLDGKVDWLSPALAESAFMLVPPAGGIEIRKVNGKYVDKALETMAYNIEIIFDEIERRSIAFSKVGAVDLNSYNSKTGISLPHIFFIASDVGETFNKEIETLIKLLIMKGRAFGIRMIMSMQNPVGESTKWRSQIGLAMTGYQGNQDHDRYILGIDVANMKYRPSMLPNPEENDISKGLFVCRIGSSQYLVRTPHLPEDDWFDYIERVMLTKGDAKNRDLLASLLLPDKTPRLTQKTAPVLTKDQTDAIQIWTMQGKGKTDIMHALNITNGDRYKAVSPKVDLLMRAVKRKMEI